jgi:hypothetical protein
MAPKPDRLAPIFGMVAKSVAKATTKLLKWSQVPIEPVADGERRIDAGQVPKRIRRAVYRLFERDRKRQLGRAATARRRSPAHGEPLAHPPQRSPGGSPTFHLATGAITP